MQNKLGTLYSVICLKREEISKICESWKFWKARCCPRVWMEKEVLPGRSSRWARRWRRRPEEIEESLPSRRERPGTRSRERVGAWCWGSAACPRLRAGQAVMRESSAGRGVMRSKGGREFKDREWQEEIRWQRKCVDWMKYDERRSEGRWKNERLIVQFTIYAHDTSL